MDRVLPSGVDTSRIPFPWAGELTRWVKVFAAKSNNLRFFFRFPTDEGGNQLLKVGCWLPLAYYAPLLEQTKVNKMHLKKISLFVPGLCLHSSLGDTLPSLSFEVCLTVLGSSNSSVSI